MLPFLPFMTVVPLPLKRDEWGSLGKMIPIVKCLFLRYQVKGSRKEEGLRYFV